MSNVNTTCYTYVPTVIITEGKSKNTNQNISMPNFSNTLEIPEPNTSDTSIAKIHSLILST